MVKLREYANGPSILKKEKRQSSSTFPVSDNRELVKLTPLKGTYNYISLQMRYFFSSCRL